MNKQQLLAGLGAGGVACAGLLGLPKPPPAQSSLLVAPPPVAASASAAVVAHSAAPSAAQPAPQIPKAPSGPPRFVEEIEASVFQKGNVHTHTTWSDGDHPPQDVYQWYRDRGYNFLAITDHNGLTDPAVFRPLEIKKRFVMITGEEVTMVGGGKQVHMNAICSRRTIGGKHFDTQGEALRWGTQQIKAQGAVGLVNHPNWDWSLTAADLPHAEGAELLEIMSGHPYVHTNGDETRLSHEAIWDKALTAGQTFYGTAVDDAHAFGPNAPDNAARPGRAWISVFAEEPNRKLICAALAKGRFYSSTGPSLRKIVVRGDTYRVVVKEPGAEVEFIGSGGRILDKKRADDGAAAYKLVGGEGYVRARITLPNGKKAWTQPVRVTP